jgi:hypothetical protein
VVAINLPLPEESEAPPQAASRLVDRPAMSPLIMVRFNFVSCIVKEEKHHPPVFIERLNLSLFKFALLQ